MPSIAAFFLIALPWLNPFSPGPMPAAVSLLFSWACAATLWGLYGGGSHRWSGEQLASVTGGAWLAAALLSAGLGLLQYFGASAIFGFWVNSTAPGEAYANLRQRNQFASLANIGLAALLWWAAQGRPPGVVVPGDARPGGPRALVGRVTPMALARLATAATLAAAVLLGAGNAASSSRTGLVQLVMLLVLAAGWGGLRQPGVRRVLLASGLAYVAASLLLPWLVGLDPLASGAVARLRAGDSECGSRLTLWGNVLHLIAQKPWLGWGWGELDYAHFITLYPGARFCDILDNAHNLPLQLAVELGVPAALLVCGGGLALAWRARPWRETDATRQMAWAVLAVILLHSLLEYPLWYGPFQMAFGLCVWLLWRSPQQPGGGSNRRQAPCHAALSLTEKYKGFKVLAPLSYVLTAIFLVACLGYAAWDYGRVSQLYRVTAKRAPAYRDNTLQKVRDSWLFQNQVHFAELTTTPVTLENAAYLYKMATTLLHFSPEPRVIEKLIDSATLLGRDDEARFYQDRYQAAFPEQYARWVAAKPR